MSDYRVICIVKVVKSERLRMGETDNACRTFVWKCSHLENQM